MFKKSQLVSLIVLALMVSGIAVAQTVHWRIKLNTGELGQIIGGPSDTDTPILTAVESTDKIGVGTTDPWGKLHVRSSGDVFAVDDTVSGFDIYLGSGAGIGTYTNHPLFLMANYNYHAKLNMDGRFGFGVDPAAATYNALARLIVCKRGVAFGGSCIFPANVDTVVVVGSSNDAATGSSLRAKGSLLSEGDVNVITSGRGFVVKESNGTLCRRITVNSSGTISASTGFTCP